MTQTALAARLKVTQPTVSRWLKGALPDPPQQAALAALLAAGAAARPRALHFGAGHPAAEPGEDDTIPVYAAAEGGEGFVVVSSDRIETIPRPPILAGIADAYGIFIAGDSMSPAFEGGDTALVNPRLPKTPNVDVVLYELKEQLGEARAVIKRLVTWSDREWTLKQYNPAKTFKLARASWERCHRIVGKISRR